MLPIGRLFQVPLDVEGLRTYADFEVIKIVDDTNPYPILLWIDWCINNQTIINFKKRILSFEDSKMRMVAPIDPLEGQLNFEPVHSEGRRKYLDQLYNVMSSKDDYINPTIDGNLSWRSVILCTSDSREALENWHNRMHKVSLCKCTRITKVG